MAERGSWPEIKKRGLLSTSALLDLYKVNGKKRQAIEMQHRGESVKLSSRGMAGAVVRDQKPMSDSGLIRCLPNHLSPCDWYELLNSKVFFWLNEVRLHKLTGAKAYRDLEHDVLEIDTQSLIETHLSYICFCPINSGCTKPDPHKRDETVFSRIVDYDYAHWRKRRGKQERVVELAVDHSVSDIRDHVKRVVVKKGDAVLSVIT